MIWAIDLDDFTGVCGKKDALLSVMNERLKNYYVTVPDPSTLTTTKKPNPWWPPPSSTTHQTTTTTSTTVPSSSTWKTSTTPTRNTDYSSTRTKPTSVATSTVSSSRGPDTSVASSASTASSSFVPSIEPEAERGPVHCADSGNQFWSHPIRCEKYYWCVHGKPVEKECPPGTVWDSETSRCDWLENVNRVECIFKKNTGKKNHGKNKS